MCWPSVRLPIALLGKLAMTPDPAVIAASLGKRERDSLLMLEASAITRRKPHGTLHVLGNKRLAQWYCDKFPSGYVISDFGRAVAAAIRAQADADVGAGEGV